jgi:hypothetical protein
LAIMVSDTVWAGLDRDAGRLGRRATARLWLAIAIAVVLLTAGLLVDRSGLIAPRLAQDDRAGGLLAEVTARAFHVRFTVRNDGQVPVRLVGFGRDGAGLTLTRTAVLGATLPVTLHRGEQVQFDLWYAVTDCAAVPTGAWPLPVRVARFFGTQTVSVPLADEPSPGGAPATAPWQQAWAEQACRVGTGA